MLNGNAREKKANHTVNNLIAHDQFPKNLKTSKCSIIQCQKKVLNANSPVLSSDLILIRFHYLKKVPFKIMEGDCKEGWNQ
jgi:hypothetical protein